MDPLERMDKRSIAYVNIFLLANKVQTTMDAGLEEITSKQWLLLAVLSIFEEAPNLKQLSKACGITHQSAKQLLDKLKAKEYVVFKKDENDKRAIRIMATPKYDAWYKKYNVRNQRIIQELFAPLSKEEIEIFCKVQAMLQTNIETVVANYADDVNNN